jgi:phosphate:Na+ symporter
VAELKLLKQTSEMASAALCMLRTTFRAFMEHDTDLVALALQEEDKLNAFEESLAAGFVAFARKAPTDAQKTEALIYTDVVVDLELIGDYCKDILERIEIKIAEKLLFNEESVKEYTQLYQTAEDALEEVALALDRDEISLVKVVLKRQEHIDTLVDEYRRRHTQRMVEGVCTPLGCNMFLNMLDYTAAIYYHTKKIARNLLKIAHE